MPTNYEYRCTNCGADCERDDLTVKQVAYLKMGRNGKRLRTRTTDWLCETCRDADPPWSQTELRAAPGQNRAQVPLKANG